MLGDNSAAMTPTPLTDDPGLSPGRPFCVAAGPSSTPSLPYGRRALEAPTINPNAARDDEM